MNNHTTTVPNRARTDTSRLRLVQACVGVCVIGLGILGYVGTFLDTISEGDFKYTADYWYTGSGLPIAVGGIGVALGVHQLQHGADGRLGRIGVWVNTIALTELFAQLATSVATSAEVRWGPSYPLFVLLTFVGVSLLAAGSWRTKLLPKWMLGAWPLVWILGSFAAAGPLPFALAAFLIALAVLVTRRINDGWQAMV